MNRILQVFLLICVLALIYDAVRELWGAFLLTLALIIINLIVAYPFKRKRI